MIPKEVILIDDVVVGILANLPQEAEIPTLRSIIHGAFYNLRDKYSLIKHIPFNNSGFWPYSEMLEQAFDNIEFSGLINKINPGLDKYELKPLLKEYYKNIVVKRFKKPQIKELKNIATAFLKYLNSTQR